MKETIIVASPDGLLNWDFYLFVRFPYLLFLFSFSFLNRRRLLNVPSYMSGNQVTVDWADPQIEPDEEIMATVRVFSETRSLSLSFLSILAYLYLLEMDSLLKIRI